MSNFHFKTRFSNIRYVIWKLTSFVSVSIQSDIEIIKVQTVSKTKTRLISAAIAQDNLFPFFLPKFFVFENKTESKALYNIYTHNRVSHR